jgi:hypothetical protein
MPLLRNFINGTEIFKASNRADVDFYNDRVELTVSSRRCELLKLWISCKPCDWQLSSIAQVCSSILAPLPALERLEIRHFRQGWEGNIENVQWLELLHPFTSVKQLFLHKKFAGLVALSLQELTGERVADVLPALQSLVLITPLRSEPIKKAIAQFVAARQISGRPVTILQEG